MTEFQNRGNIKMKNSIKKIGLALAACVLFCGIAQAETKQLGKVKSTQNVVVSEDDPWFFQWAGNDSFMWPFGTTSHGPGTFTVNPTNGLSGFWIGTNTIAELLQPKLEDETDPEFDKVKNATSSISLGGDTTSGNRGIAIGVPSDPNYADGDFSLSMDGRFNLYYWRSDYMANAQAGRESVALGNSAQARQPVSVAIGDQAIVGSLHTDYGRTFPGTLDKMEVLTIYSNGSVTATTNKYANAFTNFYDIGQYERMPYAVRGSWTRISSETTQDGATTNVLEVYRQSEGGGLKDISYIPPEEWDFYNRLIYGGQGTNHLSDAFYGVAVGSRAYVFGYHSVAYGHYAHASRPFSVAIGSESHVYSEGSQAFGYHTIIPDGSPYSLAIGMNSTVDAGLTNAIVIGVPQVVDFTNMAYRADEGRISYVPKAVKSNSINFAYHGNGIQDFFLDGISLQDRLSSEVKVVGNTKGGTKPDEVDHAIREIGNIPDDEEPLVFYSGDGGIYFFTKEYEEDSERHVGDVSKIFINGKPLSEIIGGSSSHDADFAAYKTTVSNAAERAMADVNTATNMTGVKVALTNFFNTIKQ